MEARADGSAERVARLRDEALRRQGARVEGGRGAEADARRARLALEAEARQRAAPRVIGTHKAPPPPPSPPRPPGVTAAVEEVPQNGAAATPPQQSDGAPEPAPGGEAAAGDSWELELDSDWDEGWDEGQEDLDTYIRQLESDRMLSEVVNRGTDLQRYTREKEEALALHEAAGAAEYVRNAPLFADLYRRLSEQEELLDSVRYVVGGFQEHLGNISTKLKQLERETTTLNVHKRNRERALLHIQPLAKKLDAVDDRWLTEISRVPHEVTDGKDRQARQQGVDQAFLAAVRRLDEKISYVAEDPLLEGSEIKRDLQPRLHRAAAGLAPKVHVFLRNKLKELREEGTNLRFRQQSIARRCSFAYRFLRQHGAGLAEELRRDYSDQMTKVHQKHFRSFWADRARPELRLPRPELIVPRDAFDARKGTGAGEHRRLRDRLPGVQRRDARRAPGGRLPLQQRLRAVEALVAGEEVLSLDPTALLGQQRTAVESFLLLNAELVNAAVQEASFLAEFFGYTPAHRESVLNDILGKVFAYVTERNTEAIEQLSGDLAGVMLLLRISDALFGFLLPSDAAQHSPCATPLSTPRCGTPVSMASPPPFPGGGRLQGPPPALITSRPDDAPTRFSTRQFRSQRLLVEHIQTVQHALWREYSRVMQDNLRGLREANAIHFAPLKDGDGSRSAHPCTLRYAELACELHVLNTTPVHGGRVAVDAGLGRHCFSDTVASDLRALRVEMLRLISTLSERQNTATDRCVFSINNLAAALEQFRERDLHADHTDEVAAFEVAMQRQVEAYVVQEFHKTPFQQVQTFVDRFASLVEGPPPSTEADYAANRRRVGIDEEGGQLAALVNNFHRTWLEGLQQAYDAHSAHFQHVQAQQQVLRVFFTRVLELSDRTRALAYHCWATPPFQAKLVSKEVIKHTVAAKYVISLS